jgi:hypothetical protein
MSHNPTPSAILDAKGSFIKNPHLKRPKEAKPKTPLRTTAPKDFNKEQKVLWRELMKMLIPGVAFDSDKWAIRHLVLLEAKSRLCEKTGARFTADEHTKLLAYLDRFGLNPSARTRIQVEAAEEDELEGFLSGKTGSLQ